MQWDVKDPRDARDVKYRQGLQQPGTSPFYPLAGAAQLASVSLCVSSLTLGRGRDPSSWVLGSPLLCPDCHQLSRGQLQALLPSPQDIFRVSKPLRGTKHPSQPGGCGSSAADKGLIQPHAPTPAPHPPQLLGGSAASPRQQLGPIMWLLMKSRSGQSDDIAQ